MMGLVDWRCSDHHQQDEQLKTIPVGSALCAQTGRCEADNVEVAEGDIFATLNFSQLLEITKDKKDTFPI
jgi:hypothetical protein